MRRVSITLLRMHRFELLLAILLFSASIPYVTGQAQPPMSIDALLPAYVRYGWGLALLLGSISVTVGLTFRLGKIEFIGLMLLSWPAIVYSVMVVLFNANTGQGGRAGFPAVLAVLMAVFCLDRAWELWRLSR